LEVTGTLAVDFSSRGSAITHTGFGALTVKDAIVDRYRERFGVRPSIDAAHPHLRVNVHVANGEATLAIDLAGESLHRRGYRVEQVEAPLKETLAAAILLRAGWPELAAQGKTLIDPMCGSGTLPIEAALIAGDIAPGLTRDHFGFLRWRQHDRSLWKKLMLEAQARRCEGLKRMPRIYGFDEDARSVALARRNVERAGLFGHVRLAQRKLAECESPVDADAGLVVFNPPYGARMGEAASMPAVYHALGVTLKRCFPGWRAAVFTATGMHGGHLGLRPHKVHKLYNGALACELLHLELHASPAAEQASEKASGAAMFENRVRKNLRHLSRWAAREDISCYRVYDADLPEYSLAIDLYRNDALFVHLQEYEPPATIDRRRAQARLDQVLAVVPALFAVSPEQVFVKQRRRQRGGTQYERAATHGAFHVVREGPCRFLVNFNDYLDTGLFLDRRTTRALIGQLAAGRSFLNLFGYTGTATVYAALGGATATTTIDLSRTYLEWARRNLALNEIDGRRHELLRADVLKWLEDNGGRRFGLIFMDPPSFSRSTRMRGVLDVQRDHVALIRASAELLEPDGTLLFATHLRRFRLHDAALPDLQISDISRQTLPKDFHRDTRVHQCFQMSRRATKRI
jgi:23S rRNA (guanine2445-N2)-methyltransferase / 23S rRNA (guanine2069-N7)-methyltransferase